jgi:shikimate kinase
MTIPAPVAEVRPNPHIAFEGVPDAINRIVSAVKKNRSAFLIGAGVSMQAPSMLPSGQGLKNACVSALASNHPELRTTVSRIRFLRRYANLTPELMFKAFFGVLGEKLETFFEFLRLARPMVD